jgi:hypothetical protein
MRVMKTGATKRLSMPKSFGGVFAPAEGAAAVNDVDGAAVVVLMP